MASGHKKWENNEMDTETHVLASPQNVERVLAMIEEHFVAMCTCPRVIMGVVRIIQ